MGSELANRSQRPLRTASAPGAGPVYRQLGVLVGWFLRAISREVWDDGRHVPASGGMLLVSNHVSYLDVLAVGRYTIWSGRWPRYLGKAELWQVPVVGWFARQCGQIPVLRNSAQAKDALAPAQAALERGECVGIYPEGGRTRDPDLWPMMTRTGVARLALATGVPVIPTANWGTHQIMPGRKLTFPRLWPRKTIQVVSGEPVPLDDLMGRTDVAAMRIATDRIMDAVTSLLEQVRDEKRPDGVWDPRKGERVVRGGV